MKKIDVCLISSTRIKIFESMLAERYLLAHLCQKRMMLWHFPSNPFIHDNYNRYILGPCACNVIPLI